MKSFKKNFSSFISHLSFQKGFTLIELLIVIAILGVLAAGILVAIDPVDKINQANDSKVQNDISGAGRAAEAYATTHNGSYPPTLAELLTAGELKRVPVAPSGYSAYTVTMIPNPCTIPTGATPCTGIFISGQLKSKRYTSLMNTPFWNYQSSDGKSCAIGGSTPANGTCP